MSRPKRPTRSGEALAGLLGATAAMTKPGSGQNTMPVAALVPGAFQPRRTFTESALQDLAQSVREKGVLAPLLVRPIDGGHEIVAGERRWRAAQLAGLTEVPVVVRDLTDADARVAALHENLLREDLNLIDEVDGKLALVAAALEVTPQEARAKLYLLSKAEPGPHHALLDALFAPLGETWQSFTKNKLRILAWPPLVVEALRAGLPRTLASEIVGAPESEQPRLIALAQAGATREHLRAEVDRLKAPTRAAQLEGLSRVSRRLSSRRFLDDLDAERRRELERWLAKAPDFLRAD